MKLFVTRRMTPTAEANLKARFDVEFRDSTIGLSPSEAAQALQDYDLILPTLGDRFTAEAFVKKPRAKLLANFGAGYNHIDIKAAADAGVLVTNTPDVVTDATADIALTLILMVARRASEGERMLRRGEWTGWHPTQLLGTHVSGKTLGIIGMGRIGKAIAARAYHGLGMRIVFFNRSPITALDIPAEQIETLDGMLRQSDFAIVAVPGGAETRHLIGAAQLAALGSSSFIINIARGDVIDERALIEALQKGTIAGAGLDVFENEPNVPDALIALENTTLLPHLGTATDEVRTAMAMRAMENLVAFEEGRRLPDPVNMRW